MMKHTAKAIGILGIILTILIVATQPSKLPTVILVVPFALVFALLMLTMNLVDGWQKGDLQKKSMRTNCLIAAFIVILLILQSLGQLTVRDAGMLLVLFVIIRFYIFRVGSKVSI